MEIELLSQLQRQLCSQEFQQSHDLFPGSYSIWWRGARANYRHRKRGERHLEKLYLPSHREWGSTAPAKLPMGAPQRAVKPREGEQIPGIQSSWTSLSSFSGKMKASINPISQHFTIPVCSGVGGKPLRGSGTTAALAQVECRHSTAPAMARTRVCQSYTRNLSGLGSLQRPHLPKVNDATSPSLCPRAPALPKSTACRDAPQPGGK